jgi:hypothetical protein
MEKPRFPPCQRAVQSEMLRMQNDLKADLLVAVQEASYFLRLVGYELVDYGCRLCDR